LEWFDLLARELRGDVRVRLRRVGDGNFGDVKPEGEGVSEIRIHTGKGPRIYFGQDGKQVILLLTGGDKSSQQKDIQHAKEYWKDYKQRTRSGQRPETDKWTPNGH
jgi:putative addiction module killer protein